MPQVFIPPQLRDLTDGRHSVEVPAGSVGDLIAELDAQYPGIADRVLKGDTIKPGLSVAVDGKVSSLGLRQKVSTGSEVHFLPAIGGG